MSIEPTVLVAGHDRSMERLLKNELSAAGLDVMICAPEDVPPDAESDIAVLDFSGREASGVELMQRLRQDEPNYPVIMIAQDSARDRIRALDLGADDCMSTPFVPEELSARIRAVLRRSVIVENTQGIVRGAGGFEVDLVRRVGRRDAEIVPFTRTEWKLLYYLATNPGKLLRNHEIIEAVWREGNADNQYLRVWIGRLRRKIEADTSAPEVIRTFQGIGYMFVPEDMTPADMTEE